MSIGPGTRPLKIRLGIVVALLGLLLYVNTLGHRYALDDDGVIAENAITRQGLSGAARTFATSYRAGVALAPDALYRPLSKASFAIEWALAPDTPALGHAVNVLLYALTGFLLFATLCRYLRGPLLVPFAAALLFIAHPLHTEVVANIKSRDELLCFLFFLLTALAVHRYATAASLPALLLAAGAFFLALLSKESAITFLPVLPLMLFFFTDAPRRRLLVTLGALAPVAGLFLLVRRWALAGITMPSVGMVENYLVGIQDLATQKATAVYLMGVYLARLFFPHPLVALASYPHFPVVTLSDWRFLLAFAVYAALGVYAAVRFRTKDPLSFAILYFFITASVVSNLLFTIGTNYGERLMYVPSLGFCLAIAILIARVFRVVDPADTMAGVRAFAGASRGPLVVLAVVVLAYGAQTVVRNRDWYDNRTLYSHDVQAVPRVAHLHYLVGRLILREDERLAARGIGAGRREKLNQAIASLRRALELYPDFAVALASLGAAYQNLDRSDLARTYFERALRIHPEQPAIRNDFGNLLLKLGDVDGALKQYELAARYGLAAGSDYVDAYVNLGLAHGRLGEAAAKRALAERQRGNEAGYRDQMTEANRSFVTALTQLKRAAEIAPDDYEACHSVAVIYDYLGDESNARDYTERCRRITRRAPR